MNRIAYQGIAGAYSEQAIQDFGRQLGADFEPVSCSSFSELFAVVDEDTELGLVPIENSTAGSVSACYDLLFEYENVQIIGEFFLPVRHCVLAHPETGQEDVTEVLSHPQALAQCRQFIKQNSWKSTPVFDTAGAARMVADSDRRDIVAIASELAAQRYSLNVLARDIAKQDNTTRFLLVKKSSASFGFEESLATASKTSLMFTTRHIPSALYKCLGGFSSNQLNLTKIESRPNPHGETFEPLFYIDFDGAIGQQAVSNALEELEFFSKEVRVLGSYPAGEH